MPLIIDSGISIGTGITISQSGSTSGSYIDIFGNNFASPDLTTSRQSALVYDSSDNLYTVGYVTDGSNKGIVSKFNANGTIQWQRTLGASSPSDTIFLAVDLDNSNNVYVTGTTSSDGSLNAREVQVAKYDTNGSLQWQKTLGTAGTLQQGLGVAVDAATGDFYIVGGFWPSSSSQLNRVIVAKYNTSGVLQWQRSLTPAVLSNDSSGQDIALDSAGNVYIVGSTPTSTSENQAVLVKYNSSGALQWQVGLAIATGQSQYDGIVIDSSDNIFVTGLVVASAVSYGVVAKYNTSGVLQWKKQIGASGVTLSDIAVDSAGNIYTTGPTSDNILKYDTNGSLQWQRTLAATSYTINLYSIVCDSSNNLVVGGYIRSAGNVNQILMFKVPGDGTPVGTYAASGISFAYGASSLPTADLSAWTATTATMSNAQPSFSEATSTLTGATSTFTNSVTAIV